MRTQLVGLWCVSAVALAATPDLGAPPAGHWAKDTSGKISVSTLQGLDAIAEGVNRSGGGQLKVPRAFATCVFNQWGIGHPEYNNGILLFVALEDRKTKILLGDGLNRISTGDTDAVMKNQVVSNFKAGHPEQALLEGARALAELLTSAAPKAPRAQVSTQGALAEAKVSELFITGQISDPSPRRWVIDLPQEVPQETVHALERLPNELYVAEGRQLFLVFFYGRATSRLRKCVIARSRRWRPDIRALRCWR